MKSNIQTATLSEISYDIAYGYTDSATTDPVGPKFLRITDIQGGIVNWNDVPYCEIEKDKIDKYLLEDGDIVIARTGNSTGENYIFKGNEKSVFASYLIRYKIDRAKANPFFIAYQLRSNRWWSFIEGIKGGSAQAGANAKALGSFDCYLLDPELQDGVVTVLKSLDDKIELNRQINQTLEQIAQTIFKSWFVDFDPVKAKILAKTSLTQTLSQGERALKDPVERAAMCAISGKSEAELDQMPSETLEQLAATAALFPDELVESELGLIPKGWEVLSVSKLCKVARGGSPRPIKDYMEGTIPWVKIADATASDGPFIFETKEFVKAEGVSKSVLLKPGALILSNSATCGIPKFLEIEGCIHDGWLFFKDFRKVDKCFLYFALERLTSKLYRCA